MNFDFSEEQYAFRDSIRNMLASRKSIAGPGVPRPSDEVTQTWWSQLAEVGVFSLLVPERHQGLGLTLVDLALVMEEFGRELVSPQTIDTLAATDTLIKYGSSAQQAVLLPRIASGDLKIANAISEADSGFDPSQLSCSVVEGPHGLKLSGSKILVPGAATADYLLVSAQFERRPILVLLERGRDGVEIREQESLDHMSGYYGVAFHGITLSSADVISAPAAAARLMNASAANAALLMTGIAGKVMEMTVDYVKQRHQFGKPIGSFQAIKHKCADMAVAVDSCRSAAYYAAWTLAGSTPDQSKAVSIAKAFCGDMSRSVCNEGTQLHGGMGFTWDLGLHHYLRRAKQLEFSFGDASYHRQRVIREVLAELN